MLFFISMKVRFVLRVNNKLIHYTKYIIRINFIEVLAVRVILSFKSGIGRLDYVI
jgi:hypothetical protein